MENLSGLRPLGTAVLVKPYTPERGDSPIVIPEHVQRSAAVINTRAVVVEAGPEAWKDEKEPRARPGDRVFISGYAGFLATGPLDEQVYRLVNAADVFCQIVGEPNG